MKVSTRMRSGWPSALSTLASGLSAEAIAVAWHGTAKVRRGRARAGATPRTVSGALHDRRLRLDRMLDGLDGHAHLPVLPEAVIESRDVWIGRGPIVSA